MTRDGLLTGADAVEIETARLVLEPLRVEHADEMARLLDDADLHTYVGGRPATVDELRARYTRQVAGGAPDESEGWLNWVLRQRADGQPVGYVQATVRRQRDEQVAEVAWVVGVSYQGHGYATEGAAALIRWLAEHGVAHVYAHVHPEHAASAAVAAAVGLTPTEEIVDGEVRWQT